MKLTTTEPTRKRVISEKSKEARRLWLEKNKEQQRAYARDRNVKISSDPVLKAKKAQQNKESLLRRKDRRIAYDKARDPIKTRARNRIRDRVFRGVIQKLPCEVCGDPKSQAHHEDYSKFDQVNWLCAKHHREVHDGKRKL